MDMKTGVQIDHGVPMPKFRSGKIAKYPWSNMEIGDSFLFTPNLKRPYGMAHGASLRFAPKRFKVSKMPEGYRCWRVA